VINGYVKNVTHGVYHKFLNAHGAVQHAQHRNNMKSRKKRKKRKLTSLPVITRRLFRLASQCCREKANFHCEICGMQRGDKHPNTGKKQRVEAHHIMSRSNKDSALKFDLNNLICLCTSCHKTGQFSAHKHAVWFAEWLRCNKPTQYAWVLEHSNDTANLKDRDVLKYIEICLRRGDTMHFDGNEKYIQLEFKF